MAKARTELIHCDNCGEDYADTYRRCPFCNAKKGKRKERYDDDYEEYEEERRGGKRLAGGGCGGDDDRGGGDPAKIALYVLAAAVILAIICFLVAVVIPKLVIPAATPTTAPSPEVSASAEPSAGPSDEPSETPSAGPSGAVVGGDGEAVSFHPLPAITDEGVTGGDAEDDPLALDSSELPTVEPDVLTSQAPAASRAPGASQAPAASAAPRVSPAPAASQAPTSTGTLTLSSTDFTLSARYPAYQVKATSASGQVTYSIADPSVATVSADGTVTAVGNGNTTLTVRDSAGKTGTAIVRVSGVSGQAAASKAPTPPASQAPSGQTSSGGASLTAFGRAVSDFTMNSNNPGPVTLRVQGGTAASWRSQNTSVASVSSGGVVTAVGNGNTTVECTLTDGSVLRCTVRVSGK